MFYTERIKVWRPVKGDDPRRPGRLTYVDTPDNYVTVTFPVEIQPKTITEDTQDGTRVVSLSDWRIYTPPGRRITIMPTDRIVWRDRVFDVVGTPKVWTNGSAIDHYEIDLKEIIG